MRRSGVCRTGKPCCNGFIQMIAREWTQRPRRLCARKKIALEFKIVLPDGTVKYIKSTGHPLLSADGELVEFVATHVDVTERKRAEGEHERLRQLESDLAHVNRVSIMGELAASLAHEILHPIATARNNARAGMRFLERSPPNLPEVRKRSPASSGMPTGPKASLIACAITSRRRLHEASLSTSTMRSTRSSRWCRAQSTRIKSWSAPA